MKSEKFVTVKKVTLKNNCPECFNNNGLQLTFKQKFIETSFYKSITDAIDYEINCDKCESKIYPERWTDDIERVFEYQQRAFTPKPKSKYFKTPFWILIIVLILVAIGALAVAVELELY